jgi:hypothetical protein
VNLQKNSTDRLLAWLFAFDINTDIAQLYTDYQNLLVTHFPNPESPLDYLSPKDARGIAADIPRSVPWLCSLASQYSLTLPPALTHFYCSRGLAAICASNPSLSYTQGYDRYQMVTYLLGLLFAAENQLSPEVAESISFFLTQRILELADLTSFLIDPDVTQQKFAQHDKLIQSRLPLQWGLLPADTGSFHFSLKWRLIFFACEHSASEIFLIWDALFLRKDRLERYFVHLTMAHFKQIRMYPGPNVLEQIQTWVNWDCEKLVRESVETFEPRKITVSPFVLASAFLFAIVLVGFWLRGRGAGRDEL